MTLYFIQLANVDWTKHYLPISFKLGIRTQYPRIVRYHTYHALWYPRVVQYRTIIVRIALWKIFELPLFWGKSQISWQLYSQNPKIEIQGQRAQRRLLRLEEKWWWIWTSNIDWTRFNFHLLFIHFSLKKKLFDCYFWNINLWFFIFKNI